MAKAFTPVAGFLLIGSLAACNGIDAGRLDIDLRNNSPDALDTSDAVRQAAADRPAPDARGLITYPNYQVAVARRGDTVTSVAGRLGLSAEDLGRFNGLAPDAPLSRDAVLALPGRVTSVTVPKGARPDIASIAGGAIDRAASGAPAAVVNTRVQDGQEPVRHRVARGETAFSIARLYGVTPNSLAEWNGLGSDLAVREGQYLLIPLVIGEGGAEVVAEAGGASLSAPPSAASALPEVVAEQALPASPNLNDSRTDASAGVAAVVPASAPVASAPDTGGSLSLRSPVEGEVREPFSQRNEGIDYTAPKGSPVRAAAEGTVAAITRDTDQVPILIIRHSGGYLTVYANIGEIRVEKGESVRGGQRIASVGGGNFLHFELRRGLEAVDPTRFVR